MKTVRARLVVALVLAASSFLAHRAVAEEPTAPSSFLTLEAGELMQQPFTATLDLRPAGSGLWEQGIGQGFRKGIWHAGFSLGGGLGARWLGSQEEHDFVLGTVHGGRVLSGVVAQDHWYRGNWELIGEFFGGRQLNPNDAYVAGFTPLLRYDFATGTRWVPFLEGGAGVSGTDIGQPDLATRFEFHLVVGGGVHWFWRENLAATFQYRFAHLSNAGIERPNNGVNANVFLVGLTWFF